MFILLTLTNNFEKRFFTFKSLFVKALRKKFLKISASKVWRRNKNADTKERDLCVRDLKNEFLKKLFALL